MSEKLGSYSLNVFQEKEQELQRLKTQANVFLEQEKKIWIQSGLNSNMEVLDVACGCGISSSELSKLAFAGGVTGVDINPELLEIAKFNQKLEKINNLRFQEGNIYDLNFLGQEIFDFVYARFIFQHLFEPMKALNNIYNVLQPGGIICLLDIDDAWFTLYPEPSNLTSFCQMSAVVQKEKGGDRYVGRKLNTYLKNAGFIDVQTSIYTLSTDNISMKDFLDLSVRFRSEFMPLSSREAIDKELQEIYSLTTIPNAWGVVGIFITTGRRS
ncbi:MAG: methyltransferase domain-containing protein [Nostoc sp. TH1S01]|nr:methyltransferase domain-containing protein [Nostoc sp. TH1S01]